MVPIAKDENFLRRETISIAKKKINLAKKMTPIAKKLKVLRKKLNFLRRKLKFLRKKMRSIAKNLEFFDRKERLIQARASGSAWFYFNKGRTSVLRSMRKENEAAKISFRTASYLRVGENDHPRVKL